MRDDEIENQSSSDELVFGDLYSNSYAIENLNNSAQLKFDAYIEKLTQLSQSVHTPHQENDLSKWVSWERGMKNFYNELVYDAFKELKVARPKGMEIYFAGSLAKAQATEFSDLDAFVILENEDDKEKVMPVFKAINNLCQRIFKTNAQLYPDPLGINPERLMGTVNDIYNQLVDGDVVDPEPIIMSILTSKPILGNYVNGEKLRAGIRENEQFQEFISAEKFYNKAINDFSAPQPGAAEINIKTHILRPLDFILMGLREEYNLYIEDGSHLLTSKTIQMLRETNCIPREQIELIENIYNEAMDKRFEMHNDARREQDKMPRAEAQTMLENIQKLREFANKQVQNLRAEPQEKPLTNSQEKSFFERASAFKISRIGNKMLQKVAELPTKAKDVYLNLRDSKKNTGISDNENLGSSREEYNGSIHKLAKMGGCASPDYTISVSRTPQEPKNSQEPKNFQVSKPKQSQDQESDFDCDEAVSTGFRPM